MKNIISKSWSSWVTCVVAAAVSGCADEGQDPGGGDGFRSGIRAAAAIDPASGVSAVRYVITGCGDLRPIYEVDRPLEDQLIPGGLPELVGQPLDGGSQHLFADYFQVLDVGCYDVRVEPLGPTGEPSDTCAGAFKRGVQVQEGETSEVFMLLQCMGQDKGGIDVIAALNHEPEIVDITFADSKFVCGEATKVCVDAKDIDRDPLEITLETAPGCTATPEESVPGATRCFQVTCAGSGRFDLTAVAYDLAWRDGAMVRIEDWLAETGNPHPSRSELDFFAYFDATKVYEDTDGDGYGDAGKPVLLCGGDAPKGTTLNSGDCNDADAGVHPGAEEVCDKVDNDCDGVVDGISFDEDLEVVLLQDLSGSFGDDVDNVRRLLPNLHAEVNACVDEARFGLGTFIDKPFDPYGGPGDYSYHRELALTSSLPTLQAAVDGLSLGWGNDVSESQLTALMHAALDASAYGFTSSTKRAFVLFTDAPFHSAGDCGLGSCPAGPNNADATLDEYEDYPSLANAAAALSAWGGEVIFAVTPWAQPSYEAFLASTGTPGRVVSLTSDSRDLVDAVLKGLRCRC